MQTTKVDNTTPLKKYGAANTHDLYKAIGIILMIIDHIGFYLLSNDLWFRILGRGAAPLFYCLVGYNGKVHLTTKLIVYGTILSLTMLFFGADIWVNILFTFVAAELLIKHIPVDKMSHGSRVGIFIFGIIIHTIIFPYVEYGTSGILIALTMNWKVKKVPYGTTWLAAALIFHYAWQSLTFGILDDLYMMYVILAMTVISWLALRLYGLEKLDFPKFLELPIKLLSRYSLDIYFIHLISFQAIALLIAYNNTP